jgi:hypothetical protein
VLLNFGEPGRFDADRVKVVDAKFRGVVELPVIGNVDVPDAVLVRPDGHVAWTGTSGDADLTAAIDRWS